jgi:hypothetical protein
MIAYPARAHVLEFLARRPYYDAEHVNSWLALPQSSPWCPVCADWHEPDELHSLTPDDLNPTRSTQ